MDAARPTRIRLPLTALIIPAMVLVCTIPIATVSPLWSIAYAIPAITLVITVWAGVTADSAALTARWWRGRRRISWPDLDRLEFSGQRWAIAVTTAGTRVLLPGVRPADVPRIVGAAGGRLFLRRPSSGAEGAHAPDESDDSAPAGATEVPESADAANAPAAADTPTSARDVTETPTGSGRNGSGV